MSCRDRVGMHRQLPGFQHSLRDETSQPEGRILLVLACSSPFQILGLLKSWPLVLVAAPDAV
eukprot:5452851-Heterocapsa_arctica.AAC.1